MTRRLAALLFMGVLLCGQASGQQYGDFDLHLNLNVASAEASIELMRGLAGSPSRIAEMPGSRLALSTTSTLAQKPLTLTDLERALEAAKFNQSLGDDIFHLEEAKQNVSAMGDLLAELRRRNFAQRVVTTVAQLFPAGSRVRTTVPVYVVAFGYQTVDAYVRRVVWRGSEPTFVGEGEGEVTIIVNLSKSISYGRSTDERFLGLLTVVAHEVFHAAFGVYKDGSPEWRRYYSTHQSYFDQLLDLSLSAQGEVDLPAVLGPDIVKLHIFPGGILEILNVLQKANSTGILEPDAFVRLDETAIVKIDLRLPQNRPRHIGMKRTNGENDAQIFQDIDIAANRIRGNLEVACKRSVRNRRSHPFPQQFQEETH